MDIIWFAEIKWDYLKTRKQQIISRKPENIRLLYLEPYVKGRSNRYSLREENGIFCATIPFIKSAPGGLPRLALNLPLVRAAVDRFALFRIQRLIDQLRFDRENLGKILSNIYAIHVASRIPGRFLLYDCNDAHASFPGLPDWSEAYYKKTCRSADAVFASSRALERSLTETRGGEDGIEYLGNGVDFARFQIKEKGEVKNQETPGPEPDPEHVKKSHFIYIGALAPWVDFDSIRALASRHPEWNINLVGPILRGAEAGVSDLTSLPNVTRYEPVPYEKIPAILAQADVALIPFQYSTLTRGVNPNKLYEYLAAGLPVVTTRFSEDVERYPSLVKAVEPGEPLVKACEETILTVRSARGHQLAEEAKRIAAENDWGTIAETFWKRVNNMMTGL